MSLLNYLRKGGFYYTFILEVNELVRVKSQFLAKL